MSIILIIKIVNFIAINYHKEKRTLIINKNNNNSKIWFDVIEKERLYVGGSWVGWIWFDVFEKDINNQAERAEAPPACKGNHVPSHCNDWEIFPK